MLTLISTRRERNSSKKSRRLDHVKFLGRVRQPLPEHQMGMRPIAKTPPVSLDRQVMVQSARTRPLFDKGLPSHRNRQKCTPRLIPLNLYLRWKPLNRPVEAQTTPPPLLSHSP